MLFLQPAGMVVSNIFSSETTLTAVGYFLLVSGRANWLFQMVAL